MATELIRIDRNGTKYFRSDECPRCGGTGLTWFAREGGVCFKCNGTGIHPHTWKEYTPEHEAELKQKRDNRRKKKAPEANAKFFKQYGLSEEGTAWVVYGDTYAIKDELKEAGATYRPCFGWHFDHPVDEYETFKVTIDEIAKMDEYGYWQLYDTVVISDRRAEYRRAEIASKAYAYIGKPKERLTEALRLIHTFSFEGYMGTPTYLYKFEDKDGNVVVWKTTKTIDVEEGEFFTATFTVKEHTTYKDIPQTTVSRLSIA